MKQLFGIIFCGPPGQFSVWTCTPNGHLMDRNHVEVVGQLAARSGATDYRIFELEEADTAKALDRSQATHGKPTYLSADQFSELEHLLLHSDGVPSTSR